MYFGILNIQMDIETTHPDSYSHALSLCEKLKSRFQVLARPYTQDAYESSLAIAVVMLGRVEEKLSQKTDNILQAIESDGLGRILDHTLVLDTMLSLDEIDEDFS